MGITVPTVKSLSLIQVYLSNFMESKKIQPVSEWAALREAQTKALKLDQVGMAVTIDIGLARCV